MYETVKVVNGYEIYRMIGTRRCFHVRLDNVRSRTFETIKAAAAFCEVADNYKKSPKTHKAFAKSKWIKKEGLN